MVNDKKEQAYRHALFGHISAVFDEQFTSRTFTPMSRGVQRCPTVLVNCIYIDATLE
jgi:hypothetical protein